MKLKHSILLLLPLAVFIGFIGCEGPEGPAGPEGPQGPGFPLFSYMGDNADKCGHCHDGTVDQWDGTKHASAYASLVEGGQQNNPYCLQCHTVGFDAEVSYGDTSLSDHGSDNNGFDDYWPPETEEDRQRLEMLKNVQCENCHGAMGPTIYDHEPKMSYSTRVVDGAETSLCAKCHHAQIEEWHESGHGQVLEHHDMTIEEFDAEFNAFSNCWTCHTAEGFIATHDPENAGMARPETASMNGCVACHDPHSAHNEHNLRTLADYSAEYDQNQAMTFTGKGNAQLCVQCHHARRGVDNVNGQIADGYAHFGPHGSPQMDMVLGTGSYEIEGYTYKRANDDGESHYTSVEQSCVTCHMTRVESHGRDHYIHRMEPQIQTCANAGCHTDAAGMENFDIHGKATEINNMMEQLINAIGVTPENLGNPDSTTAEQRMAGYAYVFVANDGSHGIHNYEYAKSLLQNAYDFITQPGAIAGK